MRACFCARLARMGDHRILHRFSLVAVETGKSALEAPRAGGPHRRGVSKPGRNCDVRGALVLDTNFAAWWPRIFALRAEATHLHAVPFRAVPFETRALCFVKRIFHFFCNCLARRETRRRIGARTFLSASGDLPRPADKNVRAPTRDLSSYLFFGLAGAVARRPQAFLTYREAMVGRGCRDFRAERRRDRAGVRGPRRRRVQAAGFMGG